LFLEHRMADVAIASASVFTANFPGAGDAFALFI
jgi:hypothetical protein